MHEQVHCCDEAANHQLPIAVAFWITRIVSMEECSSLRQNLMQIRCSALSVILNARVTQYTCSLKGVCRPHSLVQLSCHCSRMCIPVHSPWLPGYLVATWAQLNQNLPRNSMSALRFQSVLIWVPLNAEPDTISLVQFCYPLFTHAHSSPHPLAARLQPHHTNHSCYINNDWTFSGQTS